MSFFSKTTFKPSQKTSFRPQTNSPSNSSCRGTNTLGVSHLLKRKPCQHTRIVKEVKTHLQSLTQRDQHLSFLGLCLITQASRPLVGFQTFSADGQQISFILPAPNEVNASRQFHNTVRPLVEVLKAQGHQIILLKGDNTNRHKEVISNALNKVSAKTASHAIHRMNAENLFRQPTF